MFNVKWEYVSVCPVCESSDIYELPIQKGAYRLPELKTVYYGCRDCGVEFQNPRLENINEFYSSGAYRQMLLQIAGRASDEGRRRRASYVLAFVKKRLKAVHSFLDYGSAGGELIEEIKQAYSAQCMGVELDKQMADYANTKDRQTVSQLTGSGYDLVSIVHTLEHLPYPTLGLRNLRKVMTTESRIYIEVPKGTYIDAHVISFSSRSLQRCIELAGFGVLELAERDGDLTAWGIVEEL
jgi:hypothetical protein